MKLLIASDHAGYELKEAIKKHFISLYEWKDLGTYSSERADYSDFAHLLAEKIAHRESEFGILICGSGNGVAITANKHKDVRAALCWNTDIAQLARQHNDANILALPARFISVELALKMVQLFLTTPFEGGRHIERVKKINL